MLLELLVTWGLPAVVPGHRLAHDYISTAGATDSPVAGWFAVCGIVAASLHLFFVARLGQLGSNRWHRLAVALFAGYFIFLAIGLLFQCDPGCERATAESWAHFWFGVAAFASLGLAALASLVSVWKTATYRAEVVIGAAIALAIFDVALLVSDLTKVYQGLTERFVILLMMVWSTAWMLFLQKPDGARWKGFRKNSRGPTSSNQ